MQIKSATVITIIRILVQLQLHANTVLVKILFKIVEAWESYLDMERYLKKMSCHHSLEKLPYIK